MQGGRRARAVDSAADDASADAPPGLGPLARSDHPRPDPRVVGGRGDRRGSAPGFVFALALSGGPVLCGRRARRRDRVAGRRAAHPVPSGGAGARPGRAGGRMRLVPERTREELRQQAPGPAVGRLPLLHGRQVLRRARLPRSVHPGSGGRPGDDEEAREGEAGAQPADLRAREDRALPGSSTPGVLDRRALGGVQGRPRVVPAPQEARLLGEHHRGPRLQPIAGVARRGRQLDPALRHQGPMAANAADAARSLALVGRLPPQRAGLGVDAFAVRAVRVRVLVRERGARLRADLDLRLVRRGLGWGGRVASGLAAPRGAPDRLRNDGAGLPGSVAPGADDPRGVGAGGPSPARRAPASRRRRCAHRGRGAVRGRLGVDGARGLGLGRLPDERDPPQQRARLRQQAPWSATRPRHRLRGGDEEEAGQAQQPQERGPEPRDRAGAASRGAAVLPAGPVAIEPTGHPAHRAAADVLPDGRVSVLRLDLGAAAAAGSRPGRARSPRGH